jgi:hypothetical protein
VIRHGQRQALSLSVKRYPFSVEWPLCAWLALSLIIQYDQPEALNRTIAAFLGKLPK